MEDELSIQEIQLRNKQSACKHYSYKCSCCGLYKDNLHNEYAQTIAKLLKTIEQYERALNIKSSLLITYEHFCHEKIDH